jgi:hypothetical protein
MTLARMTCETGNEIIKMTVKSEHNDAHNKNTHKKGTRKNNTQQNDNQLHIIQ